MMKFITYSVIAVVFWSFTFLPDPTYQFAVLKYRGGGDWYANPTAVPNLVKYCNKQLNMNIDEEVVEVDVGSPEIFNYPFIHMTGHGNVVFNGDDVENLRMYLLSGGFLHIDDNYGMDQFVRNELKKVFPNKSPHISSTKSLTGHSLGATGVHETIYSLLMLNNNFLCGSANISDLDESAKEHNILIETINKKDIQNVISNSFGFGGTNATLGFSKINA